MVRQAEFAQADPTALAGGAGELVPYRPTGPPLAPAAPARPGTGPIGLRQSFARAVEHRRLAILLPFAAIAGLVAAVTGSAMPDPALLVIGGIVLAVLPVLLRQSLWALRLCALALAFWAGLAALSLHGALFGTAMLDRPAYGTYRFTVDEVLSEAEGEIRVVVSALEPQPDARALPIRRARLFIRDGPPIVPGDVLLARLRLYPVPGPVLPGKFDAQFHGYFAGIGAYGSVLGEVAVEAQGRIAPLDMAIYTVRRAIALRIDRALPQPAAGIARSIITGDQSAVTDAARATMSTAGIAHVLSISGLHLSMVAGGVYAVLRMLLAGLPMLAARMAVKRWAAGGGIVAAVLYYSISGGDVAALRSTLMIVLVLGAVIFGRRALTMRNVAIAALLCLAGDPPSLFRASFQLSFSAVVALVGIFELTRSRRRHRSRRGRLARALDHVVGSAATSLVAGVATVLFSVYHFQQTSPLGVLGNLLTLPLVGLVMMPAALVGVLAMPFGFDWAPLQVMGWSVDRMLDLAGLVSHWSTGLTASPLLAPISLVIGLAALAWFAFLATWHRLIGPALALPAILLLGLDRPPDILVADTTQAVAIRDGGRLLLVTGKAGSFATEIWSQTYAQPVVAGAEPAVRCDAVGCIGQGDGFRVAVTKDAAGFAEDCALADLVIARVPAPAWCRDWTQVIDPADLARNGAYWLAWDIGRRQFALRPAITDLNRPWRVAPP